MLGRVAAELCFRKKTSLNGLVQRTCGQADPVSCRKTWDISPAAREAQRASPRPHNPRVVSLLHKFSGHGAWNALPNQLQCRRACGSSL